MKPAGECPPLSAGLALGPATEVLLGCPCVWSLEVKHGSRQVTRGEEAGAGWWEATGGSRCDPWALSGGWWDRPPTGIPLAAVAGMAWQWPDLLFPVTRKS